MLLSHQFLRIFLLFCSDSIRSHCTFSHLMCNMTHLVCRRTISASIAVKLRAQLLCLKTALIVVRDLLLVQQAAPSTSSTTCLESCQSYNCGVEASLFAPGTSSGWLGGVRVGKDKICSHPKFPLGVLLRYPAPALLQENNEQTVARALLVSCTLPTRLRCRRISSFSAFHLWVTGCRPTRLPGDLTEATLSVHFPSQLSASYAGARDPAETFLSQATAVLSTAPSGAIIVLLRRCEPDGGEARTLCDSISVGPVYEPPNARKSSSRGWRP